MAVEPIVVQAIYSFKGSNNDELCFKKGDIITVTQKDEGWWEGTLNDKTGWFPSNYVKESKDAPKPVVHQQNQYKSVVLKDLIDSEKAHVTELEGLVTNFLQPLEKSGILTPDEYKQLTGNISDVLETHQQLLMLVELESNKPGTEQMVGKLFLTWAPKIKNVHQLYCSLHPRAVCILDKYREELTKYMESRGAATPGVLVLTTMLSKPFRRLEKYSNMLQELERHVEEFHPDRGDTQRSVSIYKDIANTCLATRRQKELELQVLTGPVRGWEGPSLTTLGDIIYMGSVAVGLQHQDRYFVLFPTTLLILSVSHRLSAFIYEGKLFLSGLTVSRLEDSDQFKNAFEISAPMIDKRIVICQSKQEADHWVELLTQTVPRNSTSSVNQKVLPSQAQFVPQPPPHPHLNIRGYCNRTSVLSYRVQLHYKPTYPPQNYPSAAPYAGLSRFFYKKYKEKMFSRKLLRQLLYADYLNKLNLSLVKIRHHRTECVIMTKDIHCRDSVINCDSDCDSDSSDDNFGSFRRQNALKKSSTTDDNDSSGSSSNPFGYIRYYNPQTGSEREETLKYKSFIDYGAPVSHNSDCSNNLRMVEETPKKPSIVLTSTARMNLQKQWSEESDGSFVPMQKPGLACENLLNLKESLELTTLHVPQQYLPTTRQSCPTKLVGNKFNESSLTTIYIPTWSSSDNNLVCKTNYSVNESESSSTTHSSSLELPANTLPLPDKMIAELLYGEFSKSVSDDSDITEHSSKTVIKPPTMFGTKDEDIKVVPETVSLPVKNIQFRKHSINSDKPKRRCSIQINPTDLKDKALKRCVTSQYLQMSSNQAGPSRPSICRCGLENCHSPRSSDSGMAGSCTLNSPDSCNSNTNDDSAHTRCSMDMTNIFSKYDLSRFDMDSGNVISLSEIEARDFESQCPCTSPFGSTPRTSCQTSTCENVMTGTRDSLRATSVTSSIDILPQWHGSQTKMHSKQSTLDRRTRDSWESGPQKSKSADCLLDEPDDDEEEGPIMYKSGLYAHWWLKAKLPNRVLRGIYEETRSRNGNTTANATDVAPLGSAKQQHVSAHPPSSRRPK